MTIRGNVRDTTGSVPLTARRSLSIALVRSASPIPTTATNPAYELPPSGLAYLAGSLKKAGHRVRIFDAFGEQPDRMVDQGGGFTTLGLTAEEIIERIPRDVDLIGVSCMFSNAWFYCRRVVADLAAAFPGVPLVVGGEHATADYDRLLRQAPEVLCCVLGEGEETIVDLAAHLSHGAPLDQVAGIALRNAHGEVCTTPMRRRILEIDEIPWPDWDTVPMKAYLDRHLSIDAYFTSIMPMIASRGCPYQCTFCSSPQMFGTKWIARDPHNVVEEMKHYFKRFGARYFEFHDLTTIVRRDWILAFSQILIDEGLNIQWAMPAGTRSEVLDADVLALMKRSGCRSFAYAVESGSLEELRRIKKKVNLEHLLTSMQAAAKLGFVTRAHLILGLPDQTKKDVLATFRFVARLAWAGAHDIGYYSFSPYPGSELYARLVAEGRLDPESPDFDRMLAQNMSTNYKMRHSWTPHLPAWSIPWLCLAMYFYFYTLQFLFHPQRLVALTRSIVNKQRHTYLQGFIIRKLGLNKPVHPIESAANDLLVARGGQAS